MTVTGSQYLVLGANGALGKSISEILMQRGATVLGTARTNESAANLPQGLSQQLLLDLERDESIDTLANYLLQSNTRIDGVINATGRVAFGSSTETSPPDARKLMQINHLGPAHLFTRLLPLLAESTNSAFVLSITGVVAEKVFPGMAAYVASKTAQSTWLKAFALEARRAKVRTIDVRPPHTETGLATRPLFGTAPAFPEGLSPLLVATKIVDAIESGITELPSDSFTV